MAFLQVGGAFSH